MAYSCCFSLGGNSRYYDVHVYGMICMPKTGANWQNFRRTWFNICLIFRFILKQNIYRAESSAESNLAENWRNKIWHGAGIKSEWKECEYHIYVNNIYFIFTTIDTTHRNEHYTQQWTLHTAMNTTHCINTAHCNEHYTLQWTLQLQWTLHTAMNTTHCNEHYTLQWTLHTAINIAMKIVHATINCLRILHPCLDTSTLHCT